MPPKKKASSKSGGGKDEDHLTRIAIVNASKCKPKKCNQECKKSCPVVKLGKLCIEVTPKSKVAFISEPLCIGCGICVKKCPFEAINIINLPKDLERNTTHRFGPNAFKLHRLPTPRPGQVLGLVGTNGIGKSTALKILSGKCKPNLGRYEHPPDWEEILVHFRGSELQNYFTQILEDKMKATIKPQYVDAIPRSANVKGAVGDILKQRDDRSAAEERDVLGWAVREAELGHLLQRDVKVLSGGELQRFAIAVCAVQLSDVYMFDEPSSYLDVKQRLTAAHMIREIVESSKDADRRYVLVVEHDLAVLDYLSDFVCVLYGSPGAYGVVTMPFSVRQGINAFLAGFIPTENLRFREDSLTFKVSERAEADRGDDVMKSYSYPAMTRTQTRGSDKFILHVEKGEFTDSEIIVLLGENGTGKTTFVRMLAGLQKSDEQEKLEAEGYDYEASLAGVPDLNVSYKPQKIAPKFNGSTRELIHKRIREAYVHPQFQSDVMKPLNVEALFDNEVQKLSGGELQRLAITLALGKPADVYLIDEPSAYLDSEQRINCAKVIKRFIMHSKKTAFVVEHDFIMATYLADRVVVYHGEPGVEATATSPQSLLTGMNQFLKSLEVTFRRDPVNFRPRINKKGSQKDQEQKKNGNYFFYDVGEDDDEDDDNFDDI
ncbi:ABC transporter-like protein [Nitzschia inconspicua]|uniref:ABC transporter-like protein n=1 Tax=Nitzschia inconspicua TaxID=303405 RepID=A0A9K3PYA4_9STRA|nr:ABC transporter-like protein [Nitzschia inconspicua]KAG7363911.1 ABC transporter-like protein [Nitzschia inconspicua]